MLARRATMTECRLARRLERRRRRVRTREARRREQREPGSASSASATHRTSERAAVCTRAGGAAGWGDVSDEGGGGCAVHSHSPRFPHLAHLISIQHSSVSSTHTRWRLGSDLRHQVSCPLPPPLERADVGLTPLGPPSTRTGTIVVLAATVVSRNCLHSQELQLMTPHSRPVTAPRARVRLGPDHQIHLLPQGQHRRRRAGHRRQGNRHSRLLGLLHRRHLHPFQAWLQPRSALPRFSPMKGASSPRRN